MRRAYGYVNYRFALKSCLFSSLSPWERLGVRGFASQPKAQGTLTLALSRRERGQKGPFHYASATEPLGDTVNTHLRTRCVLVAARRTGDPDSANNLLASHDRQRPLCR